MLFVLITTNIISIRNYRVSTKKQAQLMSALNTITDVGADVYVQHDNQNQDIYLMDGILIIKNMILKI